MINLYKSPSGAELEMSEFTCETIDLFARTAIQQDEKGLKKYGTYMTDEVVFNGGYDWPVMILEELADATKYVLATKKVIDAQRDKIDELERTSKELSNFYLKSIQEIITLKDQLNQLRRLCMNVLEE